MRVAKLLSTSVTAAALAFSMLASTIPAAAAPGLHAAYFSESSFLSLAPGQSGQFAAGFSNTGDVAWTKGSASAQASLNTRNGDSALYAAGWGPTWFNSTTYANQANDLVAPGQVGFFIYNVSVPANAAQGEQKFTGIPWVGGQALEDYGYYQSVNVTSSAITITGSSPASPSTTTTPTISGTGATATTVVTVQEGSTSLCTSTASSTGTFSCVTSALSVGSHSLTATAAGQGASAVFTYVVDTASPTIASVDTSLGLSRLRICYNKAMSIAGTKDIGQVGNYSISGFGGGATLTTTTGLASSVFGTYVDTDAKCLTLVFYTAAASGSRLTASTSYTLNVSNVGDAAGNVIAAGSTFAFTAADSTFPTATGITQPGNQSIIVSFSEPMLNSTLVAANFKFDSASWPGSVNPMTSQSAGVDQKVRLNFCGPTVTGQTCTPGTLASVGSHTLDVSTVTDPAGNVISPNPTSFTVTIATDTTRPTITSVSTLRTDSLSTATGNPGTSSYRQYIVVNYSEGMRKLTDWGNTSAFDFLSNYALSNPDGSAATTGCASGVGTAIGPNPASTASTSHASTARFEQKTARFDYGTTLFASGCQYVLTVSNVQDQAGNALNPNPTLVTISDTADTSAYSVTTASTTASALTVCYNKTIYASASSFTRGNYTSTGTNLGTSITSSAVAGTLSNDAKCATFAYTTTLASGSYALSITGVSDSAGNLLSPNPTTITVVYGDTGAPTLTAAANVSISGLTVTFSKAMTGGSSASNSAGNVNNYSLSNGAYGTVCGNGTATITATTGGTVFTITCTATSGVATMSNVSAAAPLTGTTAFGASNYTVSVRNVADSNGNVLSPNPQSRSY